MIAIFVHSVASEFNRPIEQYIVDVPDIDDPNNWRFSTDRAEAKLFPSLKDALDFYHQRSARMPTRPDGKPNRPLTAFTILLQE